MDTIVLCAPLVQLFLRFFVLIGLQAPSMASHTEFDIENPPSQNLENHLIGFERFDPFSRSLRIELGWSLLLEEKAAPSLGPSHAHFHRAFGRADDDFYNISAGSSYWMGPESDRQGTNSLSFAPSMASNTEFDIENPPSQGFENRLIGIERFDPFSLFQRIRRPRLVFLEDMAAAVLGPSHAHFHRAFGRADDDFYNISAGSSYWMGPESDRQGTNSLSFAPSMASNTEFDIENPPSQGFENRLIGIERFDPFSLFQRIRRPRLVFLEDMAAAVLGPSHAHFHRAFGRADDDFYNISAGSSYWMGSESDRQGTNSLSSADHYNRSGVSLTAISDPESDMYRSYDSHLPVVSGQDAFSFDQGNASTVNLPASSGYPFYSDGTSTLQSPRDPISSHCGYDSSGGAITALERQALILNHIDTAPRYLYNSVVNNQNITQLSVTNPRVEGQPLFNLPKLNETFLSITSQAGLAMFTTRSNGSTSLSRNATILFCFAAAFNVFGFLCCFSAILIRDKYPRIASIVRGTGFVCAAYGFLAIMAMLLDDNIMLWVCILAYIVCLPALALAFIARSIVQGSDA